METPLSQQTIYILIALNGQDRHGYAIMKEVEQISGGELLLGPSTLYRILRQLLESGVILEVEHDEVDPRRRVYRLTTDGHRLLAKEVSRLQHLLSMVRPAT